MSRVVLRAAILAPGAALLVAASPSGTVDWKVVQTADSPAVMSRSVDGLTITYAIDPEDYNALTVAVDPCGEGPWHIKDGLDPSGETVSARGAHLRKAIVEDLHNARLNCPLPDGIEDRIMTGFDEAYAQFEKLDQ